MTTYVEATKTIAPVIAATAAVVAETPVLVGVLIGAAIVFGAVMLGANIANQANRPSPG